jgi:TolB protein
VLRKLPGGGSVIDISPDFAPDFSEFAFCSNRGGGPQIYVSSLEGDQVRRISFVRSNYCASPTWSPRGDRIAYVCRVDGRFQIFSSRPDGSDAQQLTAVGNNEDPSWSPDGEFLTFATTAALGQGYDLAIMRANGSNVTFLTKSPRISEQDPAWAPVVPQ